MSGTSSGAKARGQPRCAFDSLKNFKTYIAPGREGRFLLVLRCTPRGPRNLPQYSAGNGGAGDAGEEMRARARPAHGSA